MMDVSAARITDVYEQGGSRNKVGPIRVRFEHAALAVDEDATFASGAWKSEVRLSQEDDGGRDKNLRRTGLHLTLSCDKMTYTNAEKSVKGLAASPYQKTYLAVRNKRTNEMKWYRMNSAAVGAKVEPPKTKNRLLLEKAPDEVDAATRRASMKKHLVTEFGQIKGRRLYEQADKMKVDLEDIESKIQEATRSVDEADLEIQQGDASIPQLTPPCNRAAKVVEDVYKLTDIFTESELTSLEESAKQFIIDMEDGSSIADNLEDMKCSALLKQLGPHLITKEDHKNLGLLLFVDTLARLVTAKARELDRGHKCLPVFIPMAIRAKLFEEHTQRKRLTPESRDRCICLLLVCGLIANKYHLDLGDICASVRARPDGIKKLVAIVGARAEPNEDTGRVDISLKLPLKTLSSNWFSGQRRRQTR